MKIQLDLAIAQAGWNKNENDDKWYVKTPKGDILHVFKNNFDKDTAMEAIRLGRVFELKAFNIGIYRGREIQKKMTQNEVAQLKINNAALVRMNEKLSEQLEKELNK